jgi:hypothetical protein
VTEAAGGCEHFPAFDVVRRGFGLRQRICRAGWRGLLGKRGAWQPWPDDGQGGHNNERYSHSSIRIHRKGSNVLTAKGGNVLTGKSGNVLTGKGGRLLTARAARRSIPAAHAIVIA